MQDKLKRYLLDPSGKNPDNLVRDEERVLSKNKIRAIAPLYGAFFSNSVVLYDKINKRRLNYKVDYCNGGLLQNETLIHGEAICSVILILNSEVSNNISFSYQCLGGDFERNNIGLESLLKNERPENSNPVYNDIKNLPTTFKSSFHRHDFGDMYGMDYLVFLFERLRMAIIWKKIELVATIIDYIDEYLNQLTNDVFGKVDDIFDGMIIDFRKSFDKVVYGLGFLKNYRTITDQEALAIFNKTIYNKVEEAYLSMTGLVAFKEALYSYGVSVNLTNLGKSHGVYILPNLTNLANAVTGATFLLNSYNINKLDLANFNSSIYPDTSKTDTVWSIKKMAGNITALGGVFMATALSNGATYIGKLRVNTLNELFIEWKGLLSNFDLDFLENLNKHLTDKTNPHNDHKSRIKLGNVENLPVASREEIVCNMPVRSYVTFENLMLYMKRFMTGEKSIFDIDLVETDINTQRRMQAIFSPCGPCNTDKDEWNLIDGCMVLPPPDKIPNAILESDRTLVTSESDFATLSSFLEDLKPSENVIIKMYRRVVDYQAPTVTPPPVTQPPYVSAFHIVSWTNCAPEENNICPDATMTFKVGDARLVKVAPETIRTGVVLDDRGMIVETGVTWTMDIDEMYYRDSGAKQVIRLLVESNSNYNTKGSFISITPGVMDDFAIRNLYKEVPETTASRLLVFTGYLNGERIATLYYTQEIKINVK